MPTRDADLPFPRPGAVRLRAELDADIRRLEGESNEIDMLMEQVLVEVERHEARRAKIEAQVEALEAAVEPGPR